MKFFRQGLTIFLIATLLLTNAFAAEISMHGDTVFGSAACFLFADKLASFDFTTYDIKERIVIVNVWLEQQVNGCIKRPFLFRQRSQPIRFHIA